MQVEKAAEKQRLLAVTWENTHRLDHMTELLAEQKRLEERLNTRQKAMVQLHYNYICMYWALVAPTFWSTPCSECGCGRRRGAQ